MHAAAAPPAHGPGGRGPAGTLPPDPGSHPTMSAPTETTPTIEVTDAARTALLEHLSRDPQSRYVRIHVGHG